MELTFAPRFKISNEMHLGNALSALRGIKVLLRGNAYMNRENKRKQYKRGITRIIPATRYLPVRYVAVW